MFSQLFYHLWGLWKLRGLDIGKYAAPWGKNMKRQGEKGGKYRRKRKTGKRK
jgi:hypothetical protein